MGEVYTKPWAGNQGWDPLKAILRSKGPCLPQNNQPVGNRLKLSGVCLKSYLSESRGRRIRNGKASLG